MKALRLGPGRERGYGCNCWKAGCTYEVGLRGNDDEEGVDEEDER